jgi:hypothetical protein
VSKYELEERNPSQIAVIKIGPRGGRKVINVYKYRNAAESVRAALAQAARLEA